jgi:hypothetical protein
VSNIQFNKSTEYFGDSSSLQCDFHQASYLHSALGHPNRLMMTTVQHHYTLIEKCCDQVHGVWLFARACFQRHSSQGNRQPCTHLAHYLI